MNTGVSDLCQPRFRILDEAQIGRIHDAVLKILDEVGVRVNHPEALELLSGNGAQVLTDNLVQFPSNLIEDAIESAPSNLVLYNRNREPVIDLGGRRSYFGTGTDLPKTVDLQTREIRNTRAEDIIHSTIISDALPNIDFIGSYGLPEDVPAGLHYIRCFQLEAENSIKPIFFTAESEKDLTVIWEMACAIAGGPQSLSDHPFLISYNEPTSPLTHSKEALGKLMFCARNGIPGWTRHLMWRCKRSIVACSDPVGSTRRRSSPSSPGCTTCSGTPCRPRTVRRITGGLPNIRVAMMAAGLPVPKKAITGIR